MTTLLTNARSIDPAPLTETLSALIDANTNLT